VVFVGALVAELVVPVPAVSPFFNGTGEGVEGVERRVLLTRDNLDFVDRASDRREPESESLGAEVGPCLVVVSEDVVTEALEESGRPFKLDDNSPGGVLLV